jgi:hypothetical protein
MAASSFEKEPLFFYCLFQDFIYIILDYCTSMQFYFGGDSMPIPYPLDSPSGVNVFDLDIAPDKDREGSAF